MDRGFCSRYRSGVLACCLLALLPGAGAASADLTELSIESLMQIEVTSAAKKPQALGATAAAVHVISRDDIRRSGATTLAEALRLAPGVQVARISADNWAVGVRGFNGFVSNKLLVLIDGRSVYNPTFAGVLWRQLAVPLDDIERIEVIRGPGGTLWGANAVNGVINVITRGAAETQGGLVSAGGGDREGGFATLRYGGKAGENLDWRFWGDFADRDEFDAVDGGGAEDQLDRRQAGGRIDWRPTTRDELTLQGDFHDVDYSHRLLLASLEPAGLLPVHVHDGAQAANLLTRWRHRRDGGGETTLQAYFDRFATDDTILSQQVNTWDLDFQNRFAWGERAEWLWGLGYRRIDYDTDATAIIELQPDGRALDLFSGFAQLELRPHPTLRLKLGTKLEHNEFTGFELQPNVRLAWQVLPDHTLWAALSRAVRTPTPSEAQGRINIAAVPGAPPLLVSLFGTEDLDAERLIAFEAGYRGLPAPDLSFDLTAFYFDYDRVLDSLDAVVPRFEPAPLPPHLLLPATIGNLLRGESYGLEAALEWQASAALRFTASYSYIQVEMHRTVGGTTSGLSSEPASERGSARHQAQLHGYFDLTERIELDGGLYWVDRLPAAGVDDYLRADFHLGWQATDALRAGLYLQNAFDAGHVEAGIVTGAFFVPSEIPRAFFGRITWQW